MKIFVQNSRCPSQILFAFDEVVDASVQQVRWAVAYSTRRGCERLVERVSTRMGKAQWEKSEKQFVTSLDFGLTEPAALEMMRNIKSVIDPNGVLNPGKVFSLKPRCEGPMARDQNQIKKFLEMGAYTS